MEETIFLADGRVTVTNVKFLVASRTFAMSDITSAKALREGPSRIGPAILMVIAAAIALIAQSINVLAIIAVLGGVAWWVLQKPVFHVVLLASSGEEEALTSGDREWVGKIVAALGEAIESNKGKQLGSAFLDST
jgi:hypothetical protein